MLHYCHINCKVEEECVKLESQSDFTYPFQILSVAAKKESVTLLKGSGFDR
jgi:hypothetical protein